MPTRNQQILKPNSRPSSPPLLSNEAVEAKRRRTNLAPLTQDPQFFEGQHGWVQTANHFLSRPQSPSSGTPAHYASHLHNSRHQLLRSQSLSSLRSEAFHAPAVSPPVPTRSMIDLTLDDTPYPSPWISQHLPPTQQMAPILQQPMTMLPPLLPSPARRHEPEPAFAKMDRERRDIDDDSDDVIFNEEMTNRNVCIGMIKTDLVMVSPINLTKDDLYEPVSMTSEGKRDASNYSFTVTSRSTPRRFYGWVPFEDTKVLGPLFQDRLIWWDVVIPRGKVTQTRSPLFIILYCRPQHANFVSHNLRASHIALQEPPFFNPNCRYKEMRSLQDRSVNMHPSRPPPFERISDGSLLQDQTRRDIVQLLDSIPNTVTLSKKKKSQDTCTDPVSRIESMDVEDDKAEKEEEEEMLHVDGLKIALMPHQAKGVTWMLDRENNESSCGGILADMGLGKTIQTMALVASTMSPGETPRRITLIVTPLALIQQWASEIQTKTADGLMKVLVHHGPQRTKDASVFLCYDVIVTTYQVVVSDMPNAEKKGHGRKSIEHDTTENATGSDEMDEATRNEDGLMPGFGPLFQIKWHRVVLDEAQQIKNRNTRSSLACTELIAEKRWCLTGTPIQNHVDELYSLLRFLRIQPLCDYQTFKKTISLPIQLGNGRLALERLKVVLMAVMLRRTKDILSTSIDSDSMPLAGSTPNDSGSSSPAVSAHGALDDTSESAPLSTKLSLHLPVREKQDIVLSFSVQERALYELMNNKTRTAVEKILNAGKGERNYLNMLCMLLRLRQACDHPQLVLSSVGNDKDALDLATGGTSPGSGSPGSNSNRRDPSEAAMRRLLMAKMATDLGWQHAGQGGPGVDKDAVRRPCDLCGSPLELEQQDVQSPFCQPCNRQIDMYARPLVAASPLSNNEQYLTSAKTNKIIEILSDTRREFPGEKTIIFSQFTSMLDLLEDPLKKCGFKYARYDGTMSSLLREKNLGALRNDPECTVMLISLKCGSLGLNLTAANRVILTDIWWNPAVEDQAIDRVHRIGQKLPVRVVRLLIDKTIEQKIIQLQQKKAHMVQGALGEGVIKSAKLTAQEIRSLFDL